MSKTIYFFEKNIFKIGFYSLAVLFIGFLFFLYFYFVKPWINSEFISSIVSKINLYPGRILSTEKVVSKHSHKNEKADINWSEVNDFFVGQVKSERGSDVSETKLEPARLEIQNGT